MIKLLKVYPDGINWIKIGVIDTNVPFNVKWSDSQGGTISYATEIVIDHRHGLAAIWKAYWCYKNNQYIELLKEPFRERYNLK